MDKEEQKEYVEWLKKSAKSFINKISGDTEEGMRVLNMVYGFTRAAYLDDRERRCSNGNL